MFVYADVGVFFCQQRYIITDAHPRFSWLGCFAVSDTGKSNAIFI